MLQGESPEFLLSSFSYAHLTIRQKNPKLHVIIVNSYWTKHIIDKTSVNRKTLVLRIIVPNFKSIRSLDSEISCTPFWKTYFLEKRVCSFGTGFISENIYLSFLPLLWPGMRPVVPYSKGFKEFFKLIKKKIFSKFHSGLTP